MEQQAGSDTAAAATRWILVAGTGLVDGLPQLDQWAASAMGRALARARFGLITGGWPGVDYLVVQAFIAELEQAGEDPDGYLIQLLAPHRQPEHRAGRILHTEPGPAEWLEPQKYADAVILIGGLGGTYKSWLGALHDGLPRFPLGGTGGDAELAFHQTCEMWELIPVRGLQLEQFQRLGQPLASAQDAEQLAEWLVGELLWRALQAMDAGSRVAGGEAPALFISYSRRDSDWVGRLRTLLRPAERRGLVSSWVDSDLEAGRGWEDQLLSRMESVSAALLLVSPALLASQYVREIELPAFMERFKAGNFQLFWTLLEPCDWQQLPELEQIQAIGSLTSAVSQSPSLSDQQCRLIELVRTLTRQLQASDS